ncbi:hypothetical protein LCGC14_0094530 [marine sediment metagenome]|uniref:S1 motif domain-containing protein n=1 Tax=marine sediment metagenome TaxID=412755 RepID=A0A0F9VUB4_9ZZZZ
MVDNNLINALDVSDEDVQKQLAGVLGETFSEDAFNDLVAERTSHQVGAILKGHVISITGDQAVVEVGLKSEGAVDLHEFDDPSEVVIGLEVEVLLEEIESDGGLVVLSKRKADRIRGWQWICETKKEGDDVSGKVTRKIKGGLLVDIGVPAFLPASQVDIRRPGDISEFIGQKIDAQILKIDMDRRNIVISRRKLLEQRRSAAKESLLAELAEGQVRKGVVKNIADFGVFIDLGGLDGLLHITDMSWGRIGHPSERVKVEQDIEVKILNIDREKEKVALGLKQLTENPWSKVGEHYPVGTKVRGQVVSIMSYGAFVKLEDGLEGLVHISEMSWTRRVSHPSELVSEREEIDVVVLDIDKDKQEISLGMKQAAENPWMIVKEKYPPGTVVDGNVQNMTSFGAFVEIEPGIDGMLHVSDLSWTRRIGHPSEMLQKGQELQCVVLAVDEEKMRVSLGLKQLSEDPWLRMIPANYLPGQIVRGKVTKITNFGVFIELEEGLEGLLHVSELSEQKVDNPQDVVKSGDELEVKILRVDMEERKIGLSLKRAQRPGLDEDGDEMASEASFDADTPVKRRGGLASQGGPEGGLGEQIISSVREDAEPAKSTDEPTEEKTDEPAKSTDEPTKEKTDEPAKSTDEPTKEKTDEPAKSTDEPTKEETDGSA